MKKFWQATNIATLAFALVMNFLVSAQVLNVPARNEISDKYATLLTPATYAFSIWSLIYVLLIVFVIYQARDIFNPNRDNTLPTQIGPWFAIASIANGLWTFIFVQELVLLSVFVLVALTFSMYRIIWKLNIAKNGAQPRVIVCVWWPLLIYTGWVTAATIVNIVSWLKSVDIMITPLVASIVLVLLGALLLWLLATRNVRELVLATSWAIIAIGVEQTASSAVVGYMAYMVGIVCVGTAFVHGFRHRRQLAK